MPLLVRRAPLAVLAAALSAAPSPVAAAPTPTSPPGAVGLQGAPPTPLAGAADEPRDFAGPTDIAATPQTAEELYAEGERAYFIGDYVTAVARFEAAYDRSRLPQLLYNVGLAYMRRHEITKDVADLRRAQSVLTNFRVELERDPTIGSLQNVSSLLAQIERSLAALDARKPPAPTVSAAVERPADACPEPPAAATIVKPADTRPAGAALLALGGLSLAAGVASGLGFAMKGRQFRGELADVTAMQEEACAGNDASERCLALTRSVTITTANGHTANILAGTLGGGLTALGVAGLIAGAVLYTRPGRADRRANLQLGPSLGGVWLRGAF
ncbi:MAG: hypothetical protein JNL82_13785 [Myxococcales bacterium]|nr:hypothetical protein [Myxococcales bacterium]